MKDLTDEMSLELMQQLMGVGSGSIEDPGANSAAPTTEPVPGGTDTSFGAGLRLGPLTDYTGEFDQWQLSESFGHSAANNNNNNNQLSLFDGRSTSEADLSSSSSPPDNRTDMVFTNTISTSMPIDISRPFLSHPFLFCFLSYFSPSSHLFIFAVCFF